MGDESRSPGRPSRTWIYAVGFFGVCLLFAMGLFTGKDQFYTPGIMLTVFLVANLLGRGPDDGKPSKRAEQEEGDDDGF